MVRRFRGGGPWGCAVANGRGRPGFLGGGYFLMFRAGVVGEWGCCGAGGAAGRVGG